MNGTQTDGTTVNGAFQNGHNLNRVYNDLQQQQNMLQNQLQQTQLPPAAAQGSQQTLESSMQQHQRGSAMPNIPLAGIPQLFSMNPLAMAAFGQLQMPQMSTGIPQMTGFPPLIPPQLIQEAVSLSKPVDAVDEPILIDALRESRIKGESFKDSLNRLHGINNHASVLWKDYFLDHMDRILATLAVTPKATPETTSEVAIPTVKKPQHTFKRESSTPSVPSSSLRPNPMPKRKRDSQEPRSSLPPKGRPAKKRTTLNSFTTHTPVFTRNLPAPHATLKTPEPPSREPTPPPINPVPIQGTRGRKYTSEEREYFHKFIGWCLKQNPSLTRRDLCDMLAQKIPHHSSGSWSSYWSGNHDIPDKIYASLRKGDSESESEDDGSEYNGGIGVSPRGRRPNYKDPSSDEDESHGNEAIAKRKAYTAESSDDDASIQSYSESEMGQQGMQYNDADLYLAAKHISSRPNFEHEANNVRWSDFADRHTQRTFKSWVEYFRRNGPALMSLARRIKRKEAQASERRSSIQNQRARPSWAREGHQPPHMKRQMQHTEPSSDGDSSGSDSSS